MAKGGKSSEMVVLAVDDDESSISLFGSAAAAAFPGGRFLSAQSGKAGLELARAEDPDVIFADVRMPQMDGFGFCRALKTDPATAHIPVVLVTGYEMDNASRLKLLEAGADAFLMKPFSGAELAAQTRLMAKMKLGALAQRLEKVNACLLGLGADHDGNIRKLTALCGELLGADCALYNRPEGDSLVARGRWRPPRGFKASSKAQGHICFDVIRRAGAAPLLVRGLPSTPYYDTDPNVKAFGFHTYFGQAVLSDGGPVGAVCALYARDMEPSQDDRRILGTIAAAIGVEELRQRAFAGMRESEGRARAVLKAVLSGYWLFSEDGRLLEVNDAYCRISGYTAEELAGMRISDLEAQETAEETVAHIKRVLGSGGDHFETRHRRKDGTVFDAEVSVSRLPGHNGRMVAFIRDITDRKRVESVLRDSAEKYRLLFEEAADPVFVYGEDARLLTANAAARSAYGYSAEELFRMPLSRLDTEGEAAHLPARMKKIAEEGSVHFEARHRRKDGSVMNVEVSSTLLTWEGRPAVMSICRDTTRLKRLEERYRLVSSATSDVVYSCTASAAGYELEWIAGAVESLFGYATEEIKERGCWRFAVLEEDQPLFDRYVAGAAIGASGHCALRLRRKDGTVVQVSSYSACSRDQGGAAILVGALKNVTAERQAAAAAEEERRSLDAIFSATPAGLMVLDEELNVVRANPAVLSMFECGSAPHRTLGDTLACVNASLDPRGCGYAAACRLCPLREGVAALLAAGEQVRNLELQMELLRDGVPRKVWLLAGAERVTLDGKRHVIVALNDITEKREAEEAERRSRMRYAAIFGQSPIAIEHYDETGALAGANEACIEMFGVQDISEIAGASLFADPNVSEEIKARLLRQETARVEAEFDFDKVKEKKLYRTSRSGKAVLDYQIVPILEGKRTVGYVVQIQDVTVRAAAETYARRRGELLAAINASTGVKDLAARMMALLQVWTGCEAAGMRLKEGDGYPYIEKRGFPDQFVELESGLCERDPEGRLLRDEAGNQALRCMCGAVLRGRFDPALPFFTAAGAFWTNSASELPAAAPDKGGQAGACNGCRAEGYESVALVPIRSGVEAVGLLQLNSKRKGAFDSALISFLEYSAGQMAIAISHLRAQEALRRNEARLTEAQSAAKVGNWELNLRTRAVWASAEARKIYGFSADEPLTWEMVKSPLPQAYRKDLGIAMERVAAGEGSYDIEYEVRQVNTGRTVWVRSKATLVKNKEGDPLVSGVMQDVTELKRLEAARFEFSDMLTKSLNEIYVFDAGTLRFQYANRGALRNLGYSQEELRGKTPVDIKPEFTEERFRGMIAPLVSREKDELVFETVHRRKDGSVYPAEIHLQFSDYEGRRRFLAVVNDITERRRAERELKANLEEKEVLLREIHHRVKNNLQVISSLLNLQSRKVRDKAAQNVFRESRARVHAMALVHEILYRSGNFSSLSMPEYFGKLARSVHASYRGGTDVRVAQEVCDCAISVDTAVSLGLILSELLSNAMKHAFPGRGRGEVRIILARAGTDFSLEVSDDGAGLPGGFDPAAAETLGMQLVATLTRQIGGRLEISGSHGASFRIIFPG